MCSEETEKILRSIEGVVNSGAINTLYNISTSQPLIVDYKERKHLFLFSHDTVNLTLEDMGTLYIPAGVWVQFDFPTGMRVTPSNPAAILACATDDLIIPLPTTPRVGSALAAYSQNPTQTNAAAADTTYKFGASGNGTASHCSLQNNGTINVQYAFDQDATKAGNQIYILAPGQLVFWDRVFTVLHFSTASQVAFGGTSGITVEAYA